MADLTKFLATQPKVASEQGRLPGQVAHAQRLEGKRRREERMSALQAELKHRPSQTDARCNLSDSAEAQAPFLHLAMASYLAHVEQSIPIREIAAAFGRHPSTISRRIAKIETLRDDPAIDQYLQRASAPGTDEFTLMQGYFNMRQTPQTTHSSPTSPDLRYLRRLCETGAFLAISDGLKNGVIMRQPRAGDAVRTAVVPAEAVGRMAALDWIKSEQRAKITTYQVTAAGRAALRRQMAERKAKVDGFSEQHKEWGCREVREPGLKSPRNLRVNLRESPLTMLARKKNPDGSAFLSAEHLAAGERLREDFEIAQIGPKVAQNWDRFLTGGGRGEFRASNMGGGSAAQDRLARAMQALGAGLSDIALRCCCFLEGLETAEKRMGWSARSGKIVLRIALTRLAQHYAEETGVEDRLIG